MSKTFNGEQKIKLTQIITEGMQVLHEIETLNGGLTDTIKAVADVLYGEFNEPLDAPPPMLKRMVSAGLLGRKSGRGFFTYDK